MREPEVLRTPAEIDRDDGSVSANLQSSDVNLVRPCCVSTMQPVPQVPEPLSFAALASNLTHGANLS